MCCFREGYVFKKIQLDPIYKHDKGDDFVLPSISTYRFSVWCVYSFVCWTADLGDLYAFHYTAADMTDRLSGWDFFDLQSEYLRMGVPNPNWTLTSINKDYEVGVFSVVDFHDDSEDNKNNN